MGCPQSARVHCDLSPHESSTRDEPQGPEDRGLCSPHQHPDRRGHRPTQGPGGRRVQVGSEHAAYSPEDITIKLNGQELTVEATNQGEQFKQSHVIPDNINLDEMSSSFSSDGVLVVKAPKK